MKTRTKSKFQYRLRPKGAVAKRASQEGGAFDSPFKSQFKLYKPSEGQNRIRILPPTWDDADHYGYDAWFHSGVGPENSTYLSSYKMKGKSDPIWEEYTRAQKEGDEELTKQLKPYKRVVVWVIDRKNEAEGPMLYSMPWTLDRDIAIACKDPDSGEYIVVDKIEDGYDVLFEKKGTGIQTKYFGQKISRRPSPISDDDKKSAEWLAFIEANPIPSTFKFYSADHLSQVLGQGSRTEKDEEEAEEPSEDEEEVTVEASDDEDEVEETEEEEEEKPKAKKKASKAKAESSDDEEDEEESEEDEDEDEEKEDEFDSDDEEEEDEEEEAGDDEEDEDEEKPKAKKSKKPERKRFNDDEDDE